MVLTFAFDRNCQPNRSVGGLYLVSVPPVPPSVLHVVVENEFID